MNGSRETYRHSPHDVSTSEVGDASAPHKSMALEITPKEVYIVRTARQPIRQLLSRVGLGLMLAGLFGGPVLPPASAAEVEPLAYQYDMSAHDPWGPQDYRGRPQDPWGYRPPRAGLGYGLPDRYTIHRGKKCELRCERIRGRREYHCREYRC